MSVAWDFIAKYCADAGWGKRSYNFIFKFIKEEEEEEKVNGACWKRDKAARFLTLETHEAVRDTRTTQSIPHYLPTCPVYLSIISLLCLFPILSSSSSSSFILMSWRLGTCLSIDRHQRLSLPLPSQRFAKISLNVVLLQRERKEDK